MCEVSGTVRHSDLRSQKLTGGSTPSSCVCIDAGRGGSECAIERSHPVAELINQCSMQCFHVVSQELDPMPRKNGPPPVMMKERILDKASEQLLAGSYAKLNFARIAEDLDITRANVHYHFKNKENLAIEVFTRHKALTLSQYQQLRERFAGDFVGFFQRD